MEVVATQYQECIKWHSLYCVVSLKWLILCLWLSPPPKKKVCVLKMGASNSKSPRKALPGLASAICPSLNQSLWTVIVHNHCGQQCCCWPGLTSVPTTRAPLWPMKSPKRKHGCYEGRGTLGRQKMWEVHSRVWSFSPSQACFSSVFFVSF